LLTCKDFLSALNEYLDETEDRELRREVEEHIKECPNCWVVFDTTKKTLKVFKGVEPQDIPEDVHSRLMNRLQKMTIPPKTAGTPIK
jgi:anti-sigma factor (TIGR02949 family)